MSSVGGFPGLIAHRRRTIRAPVNPIDKSTIFSIYPREINEIKHTIQPGKFKIPSGTYDTPSYLIVGPSSWWKDIDEEQPLLEIPNSSIQVADSVVRDYCIGLLGCNMANAMPGLFWLPGEYNIEKLRKEKKDALDTAKAKQDNYFRALVRMADSLWARTNGNPLCVSNDMRLAASALNLGQKDWMSDFTMMENIKCKACGSIVRPEIVVCPNCKIILNPVKFKALGLEFAK